MKSLLTLLATRHVTTTLPSEKSIREVTYTNGTFVAVGDHGTILTSPDGTTWTPGTSGTDSVSLFGATYGNGTFVVVGGNGTILTSPDGATWTFRNSGTDDTLNGITYGNGTFVGVGSNGTILTSPDGVTWTSSEQEIRGVLEGVTFGNSTFVIVGAWSAPWALSSEKGRRPLYPPVNSLLLTSPDGVAWTSGGVGANTVLFIK